ncbi:MAG: WYL domain-containing protein [Planctomycetaceae bacterium]|nr:WYL domain-containing protein [Planctomycetaceae bacterium]
MHRATRPPYARMATIDRMLRTEDFPSLRQIVERLGASRRTILDDIGFMRANWFAPIGHSRARGGYYYTQPDWRPQFFSLSEGEMVSLFIAERVMHQYRGTSWAVELSQAFRKLADQLQGEISISVADLATLQSFRLTAPSPHDVEVFRQLVAAARSRHTVQVTYWTASRDETTDRKVDPLHLANIDGDWFLLAWCHRRGRVLTFSPSRIRTLRTCEETFVRPADFDPAKHLASSFRIIQEERGPTHNVRLRFTGFAARYVGERTWHPTQTQHRTDDGTLEVTLRVSSLIEVRKWALSFGSECEALEPRRPPPTDRRRSPAHARQPHRLPSRLRRSGAFSNASHPTQPAPNHPFLKGSSHAPQRIAPRVKSPGSSTRNELATPLNTSHSTKPTHPAPAARHASSTPRLVRRIAIAAAPARHRHPLVAALGHPPAHPSECVAGGVQHHLPKARLSPRMD